MPSRRRLARIAVMQTLFEEAFTNDHPRNAPPSAAGTLQRNIADFGVSQVDIPFAEELLGGIAAHAADLRSAIQDHAPQWPLARMDGISRALLMIGAEELLFRKDVPPAVIMDEAIEIAKEYGEEESGKFVNGVLNAIAHA